MNEPLPVYTADEMPPVTGHFIDHEGDEVYMVDQSYHREDGPALITKSGEKEWVINGRTHRLNGPAVEFADGSVLWYFDGQQYSLNEYITVTNWTDEDLIVEYKLKTTPGSVC